MKTSIAVCILAGAVQAYNDFEFMQYISKHGRSYASLAEYEFRKALYTNADAVIKEHNANQGSYRLAHNKFSDRSEAEMAQMFGEN